MTVFSLSPEPSRGHRYPHLCASLAQPATREPPLLCQLLDRFRPNSFEELGPSEMNLPCFAPPISNYNPSGQRWRWRFWQNDVESGQELP
jgi:hypothetical protein